MRGALDGRAVHERQRRGLPTTGDELVRSIAADCPRREAGQHDDAAPRRRAARRATASST